MKKKKQRSQEFEVDSNQVINSAYNNNNNNDDNDNKMTKKTRNNHNSYNHNKLLIRLVHGTKKSNHNNQYKCSTCRFHNYCFSTSKQSILITFSILLSAQLILLSANESTRWFKDVEGKSFFCFFFDLFFPFGQFFVEN